MVGKTPKRAFPFHPDLSKLAEPSGNLVLNPGGQGSPGRVIHVVGSVENPYRHIHKNLQRNCSPLCMDQIGGAPEKNETMFRGSVILGTRSPHG